jgi:hypothetical protein
MMKLQVLMKKKMKQLDVKIQEMKIVNEFHEQFDKMHLKILEQLLAVLLHLLSQRCLQKGKMGIMMDF